MFTNDIRYLAGKSNAVADWLSRPPEVPIGAAYNAPDLTLEASTLVTTSSKSLASVEDRKTVASMEEMSVELINHKDLAKAQAECPDVANHKKGKLPKAVIMQNVEFSPGTLLYCETSNSIARPLVPKAWRNTIIGLYHQLAHAGQKETVKKVSRQYYWPGLKKDVSYFVTRCQDCQAVKPFKAIRPVRGNITVPDQRFSSLQIDVVGPLPPLRATGTF